MRADKAVCATRPSQNRYKLEQRENGKTHNIYRKIMTRRRYNNYADFDMVSRAHHIPIHDSSVLKWLTSIAIYAPGHGTLVRTRIQKVQNCVIGNANVVIYRHPAIHPDSLERLSVVSGSQPAQILPARAVKVSMVCVR